MSARWLPFALVALLALIPRLGLASDDSGNRTLTIALQTADGLAPTFACIATSHNGPIAGDQFVRLAPSLASTKDDKSTFAATPTISPASTIDKALETLRRPEAQDTALCGGGDSGCVPDFPEDLRNATPAQPNQPAFLICAANQAGNTTTIPTVALLRLDFETSPPPLPASVELIGSVLVVTLAGPQKAETAIVSVAGGHYLRQPPEREVAGRATAHLVHRCSASTLDLPDIPLRDDTVVSAIVDQDGGKPICTQPPEPLHGRTHIPVFVRRVGAAEAPSETHAQVTLVEPGFEPIVLRGTWSNRDPPAAIRLRFRELPIAWRPHCLLPKGVCPETVSLPEARAQCTRVRLEDAGICHYSCTSPNASFDLPTAAQFSHGEDTWTDVVRDPKGVLTAYVPPEERKLRLVFRDWKGESDLWWERIDYVNVRGPGGAVYRLTPVEGPLRVPGVSCSDHVAYQYVGDRPYREVTTSLEGGTVPLDPPIPDDRVSLGFGIGGGFSSLWSEPVSIRPYAVLHGSLIIHWLKVPALGIFRTIRPWAEWRLSAAIGYQGYLGVGTPGSGNPIGYSRQEGLFTRYSVGVVSMLPLPADLYLGINTGLLYGRANYTSQRDLLPDSWSFVWGPVLGYRPGHGPFGIEANLSRVLLENIRAYGTDFRGDVVREADLTTSRWLLDVRLRFGW